MTNGFEDIITCLCGNRFELRIAKLRGRGGKWLNESVERKGLDSRLEIQCPKCLLWFDAVTEDVEL